MKSGINAATFYDDLIKDNKIIQDLELNDDKKIEIQSKIKEIRDNNYANTFLRGEALEKLIEAIFNATNIFDCILNKHTSSNEFDILVKLNFHGRNLRDKGIIPKWIPDKFLIECKNKNKPADVELVGKFYSLISQSEIKLGIFISKNSITGKFDQKGKAERFWKNSMAFINKINLKYSKAQEPVVLLDLDLNDIEKILDNGVNIIHIIESRKDQIELDVNSALNEWISPHENVGYFK